MFIYTIPDSKSRTFYNINYNFSQVANIYLKNLK